MREGYQTLLRLLWSSQADLDRFAFPGNLIQRKVPDDYEWRLRAGAPPAQTRMWLSLIQRFLRGTSAQLLEKLTEELLSCESIPPFYYRAIQQDLETLAQFYKRVPRRNRGLRVALGLKNARIEQEQLDDLIVLARGAKTPA